MTRFMTIAGAAAMLLAAGGISANAACNGDTGTETTLGAGSGALVGGLATHSWGGAIVGGVAGGVIGNSIGRSNNREDCRREAEERRYDREHYRDRDYDRGYDRDDRYTD